jgi:HSP20 family protein
MLSRYDVARSLSPLWARSASPLHSSLDRLFQDFETAFVRPISSAAIRRSGPRVQLSDRGDAVTLLADLPGLRLEDIELSVEGETVTLKAKAEAKPVPEGFTAIRRERRPAAINWSFDLPYPIDAAAAMASLEQGRLSVTLPKAQQAKPRVIPVKSVHAE